MDRTIVYSIFFSYPQLDVMIVSKTVIFKNHFSPTLEIHGVKIDSNTLCTCSSPNNPTKYQMCLSYSEKQAIDRSTLVPQLLLGYILHIIQSIGYYFQLLRDGHGLFVNQTWIDSSPIPTITITFIITFIILSWEKMLVSILVWPS